MADSILQVKSLGPWFAERLECLTSWYSAEVIAYVAGVLSNKKLSQDDLSNVSIVMAYEAAQLKRDFAAFQRIGDWVLWVEAVCPNFLGANQDIVESLGRMSYYACNDIMHGQWHVYAELANDLPIITKRINQRLV